MISLNVKKEDFNKVRELGAVFNETEHRFEIPSNEKIIKFQKFIPLPMEILMVDEKEKDSIITSVFNTAEDYENFKKKLVPKNRCCSICNQRDNNLQLEERWTYNLKAKIQIFTGFQPVCKKCASIINTQYQAQITDFDHYNPELMEQFKKINKCVRKDFIEYYDEIYSLRERQREKLWVLDINKLCKIANKQELTLPTYKEQVLIDCMTNLKNLAMQNSNLLKDKQLQKKLINYANKHLNTKEEISGDAATRVGMLYYTMRKNIK